MIKDKETMIEDVLKGIENWENNKTKWNATQMQMSLTVLKLLIGIQNFDELPAFTRVLDEVTQFLKDEKENKRKNQ